MSRYRRTASAGEVTLNSARKDGNTLQYWYYIQIRKCCRWPRGHWLEFDVRELARASGQPIPELCGTADFKAINDREITFEAVLQRDLQRVADYCARIDAVRLLFDMMKRGVDPGFALDPPRSAFRSPPSAAPPACADDDIPF